jgi:hypothetical protein
MSEGCKTSVPDESVEPSPDDLLSDFTDYDYALYRVLDGAVDYVAQLSAVRDLLRRQKEADNLLGAKMKEIAEVVKRNWRTIDEDEWGEHFYASVYQGAAHSMAAVGMLVVKT